MMRIFHFVIVALSLHGTHAMTNSKPLRRTRRSAIASCGSLLASTAAAPAYAAKSRSDPTYPVQRTDREWQYVLSGQQYFILRSGGTESPNSSPLVKEKRPGTFQCAGCNTPLFESSQKFDSGTGWPSFAKPLAGVETQSTNPLQTMLLGTEVRCKSCGGHLGDVFGDGLLFPGTPAALTGLRYCIDGAALLFAPADGSALVTGEGEAPRQPELPSWMQPPAVGKAVG